MVTRRPTRWRPPMLWVLTALLSTGCTMLHQTPTAAPTSRAAPSATPRPEARDILLAQQFDMDMEGAGPVSCGNDLHQLTRGRPDDHPRVWVTAGEDATGASNAVAAGLGEESRLCLHGFPPGGPITVTIKAGGRTYTTTVQPVAELTAAPSAMDDLFNGRPMEVEDVGDGLLESGFWHFLPSEPALTDIARSGRFTVAARSGDVRAESEVPLRLPRGAAAVEGWERNHQLAVYGYPAGARVPIGLYRPEDRADGRVAVLQREVGRVVMPRHRVAIFTVPPDVFRTISAEPADDENPACLSVADLASCAT
ncbi:hypothetical protein PV721_01110 [Streptomyces sp. MB09-01]|uniref:hypothetical protein n=1 Tax=Streptomyces sp. MB09-01 TaxID=3028666 RepID=UPI0029AC9329|nr:hypothetical protein [Streptomyces sp. MB09-01]MDX3532994.1 hypothetical protein [Streptomyces sp. MB09-01]